MARQTWRALKRPDGKVDIVALEDVGAWEAKYRTAKKGQVIQFKRVERGSWVWRDGKLVDKASLRTVGRSRMQIISDIEPFLNIAVDNKPVGGRRQRRDMIRAHSLIEVGNDARTEVLPAPPDKVDMGLISEIKRAMGKL